MRRSKGRLAIALGCAVATAAFTGGALAGNGHGQDNAPGQQKKDDAAAHSTIEPAQQQQPAVQAESQDQASARAGGESPGQAKKAHAASSSGAESHGSAKAQAAASSDTQAGVKPSSTTTKWTHCRTGGAGTGTATCAAQAGTPATKADVSKRYGNGKTAAQIVVSRGRAQRHADHRPWQQPAAQGDRVRQAVEQERRRRRPRDQEL